MFHKNWRRSKIPLIKTIREDILTQEEIHSMIVKAETIQEKGLVAFLYLTGARISEVLNMKPEDILFEANDKIMFRIWTEKGDKNKALMGVDKRLNKFPRETVYMDIILRLKDVTPLGQKIWPFSRMQAWRILKRLNPNCYPHWFRHTRVILFEEQGVGDRELMQWFGWTSITMPLKYSKRNPRLIERMSELIK